MERRAGLLWIQPHYDVEAGRQDSYKILRSAGLSSRFSEHKRKTYSNDAIGYVVATVTGLEVAG
jgi:hypothetical protein